MRNIELLGLKPIIELYNLRSFVLSPNDEDLRRDIFSYLVLNWAIKNKTRFKYLAESDVYDNVRNGASFLKRNIFINKFKERSVEAKVAGIIAKLLMSMYFYSKNSDKYDVDKLLLDPSMKKAGWLYGIVFFEKLYDKTAKKRYAVSEKSVDKVVGLFSGAFHLCGAWEQFNPAKVGKNGLCESLKDVKLNIKQRLSYFSVLSGHYYNFLYDVYAKEMNAERYSFCDINRSIVFKYGEGDGLLGNSWESLEKFTLERMNQYIRGYNVDYDFIDNPKVEKKAQQFVAAKEAKRRLGKASSDRLLG